MERQVPLTELFDEWSYPDLLKANALLDMKRDYNLADIGLQEIQKKMKKGK